MRRRLVKQLIEVRKMLNDVLKLQLEEEQLKLKEKQEVSVSREVSVEESDGAAMPAVISSDLVNWLQGCIDMESIVKVGKETLREGTGIA